MHRSEGEKWESDKKGEDLVGITKQKQNKKRQRD